jgi:V/A-type H+-transporting ATPase subunit K
MNLSFIGQAAALCLAAIGSALGAGAAAMSAAGSWKKAILANKQPSMLLVVFTAFPLSQTIYGYLLMNSLPAKGDPAKQFAMGVFGGLAIGMSAWLQGRAAAGACDAQSETGKGTANYILALGIIETVAILVLVFLMIS